MNLYERATRDIKRITTNENEWGEPVTLSNPDGSITAIFACMKSAIHLAIDALGNQVNAGKSHIGISEPALLEANPLYPVRDGDGEVNINGHLVTIKDSTGIAKTYVINQTFPDETVGLIVCMLGNVDL